MAETATVATSRAKLAEVLANWPDEAGDNSWAVAFISAAPTAGEMAAIREAAKVCDRVVVARLVPQKAAIPGLAETVRSAGGDILYVPKEAAGRVKVAIEGEKNDPVTLALMAETLLTVLSNLVVVPRGGTAVVRTLRAFQGSWGELFSLRVVA